MKINNDAMQDVQPEEMKKIFGSLLQVIHGLGMQAIDDDEETFESPMELLLICANHLDDNFKAGHTLCIGEE